MSLSWSHGLRFRLQPGPGCGLAPLLGVMAVALLVASGPAGARNEKPGKFDYLTVALSWSPTYCSSGKTTRRGLQCSGRRRYAFVLHGLWPQYERGWPEFCRTEKRPWVARSVIDDMLDIMPSKKLIIHQYKKHGTCSGLAPKTFFRAARVLYERIKIPKQFVEPGQTIRISPAAIEDAFLEANPDMRPEHIAVVCGRRHRLREIRVCFTPRGNFRTCSINEDQRRLCRSKIITLPPVRQSRRSQRSQRQSRSDAQDDPGDL